MENLRICSLFTMMIVVKHVSGQTTESRAILHLAHAVRCSLSLVLKFLNVLSIRAASKLIKAVLLITHWNITNNDSSYSIQCKISRSTIITLYFSKRTYCLFPIKYESSFFLNPTKYAHNTKSPKYIF